MYKDRVIKQDHPLLDLGIKYGEYLKVPIAPELASYPGESNFIDANLFTSKEGLMTVGDFREQHYVQPKLKVGFSAHVSQHNQHSVLSCESSVEACVLEANLNHMFELMVQEYGGVDYKKDLFWKAIDLNTGLTYYYHASSIENKRVIPNYDNSDLILIEGFGLDIGGGFIVFSTKTQVLEYMIKKYNEL